MSLFRFNDNKKTYGEAARQAAVLRSNQYAAFNYPPHLISSSSALQVLSQTYAASSSGLPEPEPEKELEFSFSTDPIVAERGWAVVSYETRNGGIEQRLAPIAGSRTDYPTFKRMEASCTQHHHEAPHRNCHCGVWAVKPEHMLTVKTTYTMQAWGEVYLWGRVLEGSKGYRAQYAYPKSLNCYGEEMAEKLGLLYGVPVTACVKPKQASLPWAQPPSGGYVPFFGSGMIDTSSFGVSSSIYITDTNIG